jgi:hypothetical protein
MKHHYNVHTRVPSGQGYILICSLGSILIGTYVRWQRCLTGTEGIHAVLGSLFDGEDAITPASLTFLLQASSPAVSILRDLPTQDSEPPLVPALPPA